VIAYFDTSALVKLFVAEIHSDLARAWAKSSVAVVVSQIAWTEYCAALALKRRTSQLPEGDLRSAVQALRDKWPGYQRLDTDEALFVEAGELAMRHELRAYDSVHLASARRAFSTVGPGLRFCCFDRALNRAAMALGIATLGATEQS
jgi:predicted nucleic acid-binding protein